MKKMMLLTLAILGLATVDASARYRRYSNCNSCVQEACPKEECAPCERSCPKKQFCLPAAPCAKTTSDFSEGAKPCCVKRYVIEQAVEPNVHISTTKTYSCPVAETGCEIKSGDYKVQEQLLDVTGN